MARRKEGTIDRLQGGGEGKRKIGIRNEGPRERWRDWGNGNRGERDETQRDFLYRKVRRKGGKGKAGMIEGKRGRRKGARV